MPLTAQEIIPSGIAKDVTLNEIKSLLDAQNLTNEQLKALNDTILYFVTAMLEKMPRLDANDRAAINMETGTISNIATITTITNMTNLNNLSGGNTAPIPYHLSNLGALHIYNNIKVL